MRKPDVLLLLLFLLLAGAVVLRVSVETTGYRSPDSHYYLEAAGNLLAGRGLTMSNEYPLPEVRTASNQVPFTAWPVGYPLLIAGVAWVTGLGVFWASKQVNILCLGGCLLLLRSLNRQKAWLLGLLFCSFTMLEVFSYTWSEGPFLFFLLLFCLALSRTLSYQNGSWAWLLLSAIGLFMVRYIGLFAVPVLGLAALWALKTGARAKAARLLAVGFAAGLFVLAYFYFNYSRTGSMWGGSRVFAHHETVSHFLFIWFRGLMNEFFVIRNHYFRGPVEPLFLLMAALQLVWMVLLWLFCLRGRVSWRLPQAGPVVPVFWLVAGAYMLLLTVLRILSPFDAFDYRLLSPVTLLVHAGLLYLLLHPRQKLPQKRLQVFLVVFFLLSFLMNLPKEYLLGLLLGQG